MCLIVSLFPGGYYSIYYVGHHRLARVQKCITNMYMVLGHEDIGVCWNAVFMRLLNCSGQTNNASFSFAVPRGSLEYTMVGYFYWQLNVQV